MTTRKKEFTNQSKKQTIKEIINKRPRKKVLI